MQPTTEQFSLEAGFSIEGQNLSMLDGSRV
jgi:hypothetical protein